MKNFNGYTVGKYKKWHQFLDAFAKFVLGFLIVMIWLVILLIATITIWA